MTKRGQVHPRIARAKYFDAYVEEFLGPLAPLADHYTAPFRWRFGFIHAISLADSSIEARPKVLRQADAGALASVRDVKLAEIFVPFEGLTPTGLGILQRMTKQLHPHERAPKVAFDDLVDEPEDDRFDPDDWDDDESNPGESADMMGPIRNYDTEQDPAHVYTDDHDERYRR